MSLPFEALDLLSPIALTRGGEIYRPFSGEFLMANYSRLCVYSCAFVALLLPAFLPIRTFGQLLGPIPLPR
jgi:hypothetical protein